MSRPRIFDEFTRKYEYAKQHGVTPSKEHNAVYHAIISGSTHTNGIPVSERRVSIAWDTLNDLEIDHKRAQRATAPRPPALRVRGDLISTKEDGVLIVSKRTRPPAPPADLYCPDCGTQVGEGPEGFVKCPRCEILWQPKYCLTAPAPLPCDEPDCACGPICHCGDGPEDGAYYDEFDRPYLPEAA